MEKKNLSNFILILLIFFLQNTAIAQVVESYDSPIYNQISKAFSIRNTNLDSAFILWFDAEIREKLKPNDIEMAYLHQVGSNLYRAKSEYTKAAFFATSCYKIYTKLNDTLGISIAYMEMGNNFLNQNQLDSAKLYFEKCYMLKKNIKDDNNGRCIALSNLGTVEDYRGNYLKASDYYYQSIDLNEKKVGNKNMLSDAYHNLSIVQYNVGNIDNAISYQIKAVTINKEIKNLYSESMNHVCLSAFYLEKNKNSDAEKHGILSEKICRDLKYSRGLLYAQSALGDVYLKLKNYSKALSYFDTFLKGIDAEGDPYMKAQVMHKKAKVLIQTNNYDTAISHLNSALASFEKSSTTKELKEVHEDLSICYKLKGDNNASLHHLELSNTYRDSLFKEEKTKELLNLEAKYQSNKKEAENIKLQAEQKIKEATISSQKILLWSSLLGLLSISFLSFFLYRQRQKQKTLTTQVTSQRDQIQLLNRELNHRVKNNLAFMTSLLEMQGRRSDNIETKQLLQESETRLKTLALVHANLFKNEADTDINLKSYLTEIIQNLNQLFELPDKSLEINTNLIDHNIDAEDAMRLGLVVNELITNSVKHAFHDVSNPEIKITTLLNAEGKLVLDYKDNGPGASFTQNASMQNSASLGTKLIELLKRQLEGRVLFSGL